MLCGRFLGRLKQQQQQQLSLVTRTYTLQRLSESRGVLKIAGDDAAEFLQGMVTNDITALEQNKTMQYGMLLNPKGRVLIDLFLYRIEPSLFYLDCARPLTKNVISFFHNFKLRSKVWFDSTNIERR